MKKFKLYSLALVAFIGLASCEEENNALTGNENTGGLVTVNNALVGYVVGNGNDFTYPASFTVFQGEEKLTNVDVYKVFTDINGNVSNEVFLKSVEVPATPQSQTVNFTVTYNELIEGLTVNGSPLSTDDATLNIGDYWTLKYVGKTTEGDSHLNSKVTKVSVGTRFAGNYKVIEGLYWRINTPRPDIVWVGQEVVVESVNSTTYKYLEYAGPFYAVTNTHYFTIDNTDVVRTPTTYNGNPQLINGYQITNCEETPGSIVNACGYAGPQNTVVRDDVNGKDKIYRTYGYYTTGSGPREFYEVIEKQVN